MIYERTPKDLTSELKEAKTEIKSLEDDVDYYEYETFLEFTKRKFSTFVHRWVLAVVLKYTKAAILYRIAAFVLKCFDLLNSVIELNK